MNTKRRLIFSGIIALSTIQFSWSADGPTATPPASSENPHLWAAASEKVLFCDLPSCPGSSAFSVARDGTYYIGDPSVDKNTGKLTDAELTAFSSAATAVAAQDLSKPPTCTPAELASGATGYIQAMAFSNETTSLIAEVNKSRTCINGDPALATALRDQFHLLEMKYDSKTPPAPSPSPLPSIEPSTLPSIVPSDLPSSLPTIMPTGVPSNTPSPMPSVVPSPMPSPVPTIEPIIVPTPLPSVVPSAGPAI